MNAPAVIIDPRENEFAGYIDRRDGKEPQGKSAAYFHGYCQRVMEEISQEQER